MGNNPGDSVRIVLFDKDDTARFLTVAEADDPENFKLVGGKFDSPDELPDHAATRELGEEVVGLSANEAGLTYAGELLNDDGESKRYIFYGMADPQEVDTSDEVASSAWGIEAPEGKNKHHIESAVDLARRALQQSRQTS